MGEGLFVEIDNDIAEIARVGALIDSFGERHRIPEIIVFYLNLAFDELLTNIISYGFIDGGRHKISVSVGIEGERITAEIIDDGIAFDPLAKAAPNLDQPLEERAVGGLGIHFIRTVMDQVGYHRADGRNHFQMIKKVPTEPVE